MHGEMASLPALAASVMWAMSAVGSAGFCADGADFSVLASCFSGSSPVATKKCFH